MKILYVPSPWLCIIFLYCFWIYLSVDITVASGQMVDDQDRQLLLKLKNSLKFKFENSTKLVSWNPSTSCSEWGGVTYDEEGHVTGLDLSGESIYGGLDNSSSLFNLKNLQRLNLASNSFNSAFPSGFNNLKKLTYLNLSQAGFMGQIPLGISHLTRLVTLDISLSSLYDQLLKLEILDIQKFVQNFTRIRQLYLDGISIRAQGHEWCNALLLLPSLQELSMSNCNLSGPLDPSLARLENLSFIRLDQNNLSSEVPETLANLPNLTTLQLSSCGLTGVFPEKIFQVAKLSVINLSFNKNLYGSFPDFPSGASLHTLIVSNTGFSGELPVSMSNLRQLSILDLSSCQFNSTLPRSISKLGEITHLHLSFNNFTGPIPSLNMSKNLIHLDLSHNAFTGSIASVHLEGLRKLVLIDLQDNFLTGSVPPSLFTPPLLQSVQLSNNNFQGRLSEFSNSSSSMLEVLDLSSNKIGGSIPTSIFHLRSLNVLQLYSNKLNGTLKLDVIQRLVNLTTLDLSHNNLSIEANVKDVNVSALPKMSSVKLASCNLKEFPSFLRNQSRLNSLDLSGNHIGGSIPTWIWQLGSLTQLNLSHNLLQELEEPVQNPSPSLSVLDLHSNQLQGELQVFHAHLTYLDLSSNNLSSTFPSNIGTHLSSIIFLSLSKNNLSGSIPPSLCNNSNLLVIDVSSNQFEGKIPQCLTQSETLVVLNMQNNKLDGEIPDTFPASCALKTLDLNGNLLGGSIPKSLAQCSSLEVLDIGTNQLSDGFPCFLKPISTLRVMVLRGNKFDGPIGCPQTNDTWHMLQIVDVAFNNFSGPLPVKCLKTWEAMMLEENYNASKFNHIGSQILTYGHIYYQDSVTLTSKGLQMEFVKILTVFTSVDFSSNNLQGPIPEELINFTALRVLNLSHNALNGTIPSSIGNLKLLESLDLSNNYFDGGIPTQLASLTFLSYLNLSFNHLVGKIPAGTQLQTFDAASFADNERLCGSPLPEKCSSSSNPTEELHQDSRVKFKCSSISIGVGFGVGAGLVVAPCMFWHRGRKWSNNNIDKILLFILPLVGLSYTPIDDDEAEDDTEENNSDMEEEEEEECDSNEEDTLGDHRFQGKFCVFCSKLNISKKRVIHDQGCTCYHSSTLSTSTYPESYS
ncbi:LOW QUALITY PROTEIN: receptor-like protein 40 [Lotus japonicus]|uniref:LOW QUALITY PROTEIN: receptor-like protein 40 n=1 Tax=Lotus japonicus TaxID=34305 RepID=UPI002584491C|nr:LOW QUALITY PROTEIN: receptor-like protein 40 [Lotus japonicus]